jgi:membrane-associated phospholipid phosphatase
MLCVLFYDKKVAGMKRIASFHMLTILFLSALILLTLFFHQRIPGWPSLILRLLLGLGLVLAIVLVYQYKPTLKVIRLIHDFSPLFFILFIFNALGDLIPHLHPDIDSILVRMDFWIFGNHPAVWLQHWIAPRFTDLMSLAYATYYFMPVVLILALYIKKQKPGLYESISILVFGYYLSYIGYLLFPAIGPRFTLAHLYTVPLNGGPLTNLLRETLNALEHNKRDCMPSGHTQIALMTLVLAYRYARRLFYIYLPLVLSLIFSTVYLRYHYAIDVLAGAFLAALCLVIGPKVHQWWEIETG